MFTGLIEEVGVIRQIEPLNGGLKMTVGASAVLTDARLGDSIAIDGVCTTVIALTQDESGQADGFTLEASPETLSKTTMNRYKVGQRVNLERPLTPHTRLGGHFVTGHIDGMATIAEKYPEGISWIYTFRLADEALAPLLVPKGSVAVNGISLTVNTVADDSMQGHRFSVAIIPHTLAHTSLGDYNEGDTVNIETDLLGKYVLRLSQFPNTGAVTAGTILEGVSR